MRNLELQHATPLECDNLHPMQILLTMHCLAGGVKAPSQNGGTIKVAQSPDATDGTLTPTTANLQNPDVSSEICQQILPHKACCHWAQQAGAAVRNQGN